MNKTLLAALSDSERLLVAETELAALDPLDEDEVVALHDRIRRARTKYVGLYRRGASARVGVKGGRGAARPANEKAALKAEAFEEALSRVSRRLAALSRQSAGELRGARIAAARSGASQPVTAAPMARPGRRSQTAAPSGDRKLRSPASEKRRAGTRSLGAKRQAKRDSK